MSITLTYSLKYWYGHASVHHQLLATTACIAGPLGFPAIMAYVGAAIYFVQQSNGEFFDVVLALLQAIVWPVYVVYHVLQALGA